jgi:hypothetical protein
MKVVRGSEVVEPTHESYGPGSLLLVPERYVLGSYDSDAAFSTLDCQTPWSSPPPTWWTKRAAMS